MVARSGGDAGAGADEAELGRATIGGRVDGKVLLMAADQVPDVQVILVDVDYECDWGRLAGPDARTDM